MARHRAMSIRPTWLPPKALIPAPPRRHRRSSATRLSGASRPADFWQPPSIPLWFNRLTSKHESLNQSDFAQHCLGHADNIHGDGKYPLVNAANLVEQVRSIEANSRARGESMQRSHDNQAAVGTVESEKGTMTDSTLDACIEAEDRFQLSQFAIDHHTDGVLWTTPDGRLIYVNDAAVNMLRCDRSTLLTLALSDILQDWSNDDWTRQWQCLVQNNRTSVQAVLLRYDGTVTPVDLSNHYLTFKGREFNCCFLRDIWDSRLIDTEYQSLRHQLEQQVDEQTSALREEIKGREGIEAALLDETEKLQSILDNAGQGFLTFRRDLKVDVQYSEEARRIFGGEIWGASFPETVYPDDPSQQGFLRDLLTDVFSEPDADKREIFFSLLPNEAVIGGRTIDIKYKDIPLGDDDQEPRLMAVLTDITETRRLQNQLEVDRNRLKMVVKAVTNYNELVEAARDYQLFCSVGLDELVSSDTSVASTIDDIYRRIHTFKGTFGQLDFVNVVRQLHDLEARIADLRSVAAMVDRDRLFSMLDGAAMRSWLDRDMQALTDILGQEYFSREEKLEITPSQLFEIEEAMISLLSPVENKQLLPRITRLRYRPMKAMLGSYVDFVHRLATTNMKPIKPFTIDGDEVDVDPVRYHGFIKSLVHIFRNLVDHGLETEEERVRLGKNPEATVRCRIRAHASYMELEIADDGRGIDVCDVKRRVRNAGIMDEATLEAMKDAEAVTLIFLDGVSTAAEVNEISGRGIGLAAVKQELNKLGGTVAV
ncbi:PAS domain-containing protein, partial [candidate division GN15 bacterium]|nr:PAS domain-containing protein [candidate division GN15 bacterium]